MSRRADGHALAAKARPDLVLLDANMRGLDGLETCRHLKSDTATRAIPLTVVAALDAVADKIAGLEAGGVDYVTKPLQPAEVLARVRVHLESRRLRAELQAEVRRRALRVSNSDSPWFKPELRSHSFRAQSRKKAA